MKACSKLLSTDDPSPQGEVYPAPRVMTRGGTNYLMADTSTTQSQRAEQPRRSRSVTIARGALALGAAQVAIALAQILYAGATSRMFGAGSFGDYTIGMTATGLVLLLLTTGLPSFVLASAKFDLESARAVVLASSAAGILGTLILLLAAPAWSAAWGAPGATNFVRLLGLQVGFGSFAGVQLALLRREGRPTADAAIQAGSSILGFIVGFAALSIYRNPLFLCINPIVTTAGSFAASLLLRRQRLGFGRLSGWREILRFSRIITWQNGVFYVLTTLTVYLIPVVSTTSELGQYSRAAVVTTLPSSAAATALTRALAPFYRHLDRAAANEGLQDASVLAAALVVPLFGMLAVLAGPLLRLLLGSGWAEASVLTAPLAIGAGLYVVFTLLANGAELRQVFRPVRTAQRSMLIGAAVTAGLGLALGSPFVLCEITLVIGALGLLALLRALPRYGALPVRAPAMLLRQMLTSSIPVVAALAATMLVRGSTASASAAADQILVAVGAWAVATLCTVRYMPAFQVAIRRGLLPARIRGS